jgi:hypothetical protein
MYRELIFSFSKIWLLVYGVHREVRLYPNVKWILLSISMTENWNCPKTLSETLNIIYAWDLCNPLGADPKSLIDMTSAEKA